MIWYDLIWSVLIWSDQIWCVLIWFVLILDFLIDAVYFVYLDDTILILHRYELFISEYCCCCHRNDDLYFISLSLARHVRKSLELSLICFLILPILIYWIFIHINLLYSTQSLCFTCHNILWLITVWNKMIIVDLNTHVILHLVGYYHDNIMFMCHCMEWLSQSVVSIVLSNDAMSSITIFT